MEPIKIDLRDMTQEMVDKAIEAIKDEMVEDPNHYTYPCIIGSLMSPEDRATIPVDLNHKHVSLLILRSIITLPEGQDEWAGQIQDAFDLGRAMVLEELCRPWVAADKTA